jgi:hypothetical protein
LSNACDVYNATASMAEELCTHLVLDANKARSPAQIV